MVPTARILKSARVGQHCRTAVYSSSYSRRHLLRVAFEFSRPRQNRAAPAEVLIGRRSHASNVGLTGVDGGTGVRNDVVAWRLPLPCFK